MIGKKDRAKELLEANKTALFEEEIMLEFYRKKSLVDIKWKEHEKRIETKIMAIKDFIKHLKSYL